MDDLKKTKNSNNNNNSNTNSKNNFLQKNIIINRTTNAINECISNSKVPLSESGLFLGILLLLYFTSFYSTNLINNLKSCNQIIDQQQYDEYISSVVYWFISFILIIILRYNKINIVNKFYWDFNLQPYVGQIFSNIISLITSVVNVAVIAVMFVTLYKIIVKTFELIECKENCNVEKICLNMENDKNITDVKYLKKNASDNIECYNELFENIGNNNTSEVYKDRLLSTYLKKPVGIFLYVLSFIISLIVFFNIGWKDPELNKFDFMIGFISFIVSGTIYGVSAYFIHTEIFKSPSRNDDDDEIPEDFETGSLIISISAGSFLGLFMIFMIFWNFFKS